MDANCLPSVRTERDCGPTSWMYAFLSFCLLFLFVLLYVLYLSLCVLIQRFLTSFFIV